MPTRAHVRLRAPTTYSWTDSSRPEPEARNRIDPQQHIGQSEFNASVEYVLSLPAVSVLTKSFRGEYHTETNIQKELRGNHVEMFQKILKKNVGC